MAGGLTRQSIVSAVAPRQFGKPRPSLIVQTDLLNDFHPTLLLCLLTTDLIDANRFRVPVSPSARNGLTAPSQVMVDKVFAIERARIRHHIGRLSDDDMSAVEVGLGYMLGLGIRW